MLHSQSLIVNLVVWKWMHSKAVCSLPWAMVQIRDLCAGDLACNDSTRSTCAEVPQMEMPLGRLLMNTHRGTATSQYLYPAVVGIHTCSAGRKVPCGSASQVLDASAHLKGICAQEHATAGGERVEISAAATDHGTSRRIQSSIHMSTTFVAVPYLRSRQQQGIGRSKATIVKLGDKDVIGIEIHEKPKAR